MNENRKRNLVALFYSFRRPLSSDERRERRGRTPNFIPSWNESEREKEEQERMRGRLDDEEDQVRGREEGMNVSYV